MKLYPRLLAAASMLVATCLAHAQPYQNLTLLQEIDAGATPSGVFPNGNYESDGSDSVQTILGQSVRVTDGTVGWFGYKLGNNLEYNKPYVIEVVYPEDTPRSWLMSLMDCGGYQPGSHFAFHSGVYEAETYRPPIKDGKANPEHNPLNIVSYPLRQQFKSHWIIAWPQDKWWAESTYGDFPDTHGAWTTGLWLYFVNKSDDPGNNGVAVKTIRLYSVPDVESLIDPQVDNLRVASPRMTFWTLESPGRNNAMTQAGRARIAGANTLVPALMEWNFQHSGANEYNYYRAFLEARLAETIPAARRHHMGILPKLEYGGSPFMPAEAYAVTANNVGYDEELTKVGHGTGLYKCLNPRIQAARDDLKHLIDVVFEAAGDDVDLIKGVMIRNRLALIAPSFSDADIAAYESETSDVIAETDLAGSGEEDTPDATSFDKKRRTLRLAFWNPKWALWGHSITIGAQHAHPYMQWYYGHVADFLQEVEDHMKTHYGNDKVLVYLPFSGEGVFQSGMTNPPENFFAGQEWGYTPGMTADKSYLTLMPTDQYWNAQESDYLNALNSLGGQATLIDPMYVEFGWSGDDRFPYAKIAPSFEHGGQEYGIRSELLAVARANPRLLGKSAFGTIHRGNPEHWNAFAKNFYLMPDEAGTVILDDDGVVAKSFSGGRVLVINTALTAKTVDLSSTHPTLYNKITGASVNSSALALPACSMQMYGTQSGGLPAYTVLPEPPPGPARHITQFEDGTLGGTGGSFSDNLDTTSFGEVFNFASGTSSWVDVVVNVPSSGTYDLKFRYSLQSGSRPLHVVVNNEVVANNEDFPATGHWRDFRYHTVSDAQLYAGTNHLRLLSASNGGPALDQVEAIRTGPLDFETYFESTFAGGDASAWSGGTTAPWSVVTDAGDHAYQCDIVWTSTTPNVAGQSTWTDYQLDFDFKITSWSSWSYVYSYARYIDADNHYRLSVEYTGADTRLRLHRFSAGTGTLLATAYDIPIAQHTWYHTSFALIGDRLIVLFDDTEVINIQDPAPLAAGKIGIGLSKQRVLYDNVTVTGPTPPQLVYQGEDHTDGVNATTLNNIPGYTGTGHVETSVNGAWFEWNNVNVGAGTKTLTFRYVSGSSYDRAYKIYVNGVHVGTIPCVSTGGWTTWGTVSLPGVTFYGGNNVVRLEASTWNNGPGGAAIDKMEVQ